MIAVTASTRDSKPEWKGRLFVLRFAVHKVAIKMRYT